MLVNQGGSAPWSSSPFALDGVLHSDGFGSTHSPTLLSGFVGECCFVGELGISFESDSRSSPEKSNSDNWLSLQDLTSLFLITSSAPTSPKSNGEVGLCA